MKKSLLILNKPSDLRTRNDLKLLSYFIKPLPFFSKIFQEKGADCLYQCLKYISLESHSSQSFIFEKGSFGSKFYIILKGSVSISFNFFTEAPETTILNQGDSFGELALITGNPRTATVKCEEDSVFGVFDKHYFHMAMNANYLKEINEKIEFLKQIFYFQGIPQTKLNSLVYYMKEKSLIKGNYLYKEGEKTDEVYLVKKGDFRIMKKGVCIGVIGSKEVIGFEEIALKTQRKYSVECISAVSEVFFIQKRDFLKKIKLDDERLKEMLGFTLKREEIREESFKKAVICREAKKKEFIENFSLKPNFQANKSLDIFSIKSPFERERKKLQDDFLMKTNKKIKANFSNNMSFEINIKKKTERISSRNKNSKKREDISTQIDFIVKAKEKILNRITNKTVDNESFLEISINNGRKQLPNIKLNSLLNKRVFSFNYSNLL